MEKSIEKIKLELEQKRKHNTELLQTLKQKSIIYNAEKEKQKRYFLNKTSSFLNKKRKAPNSINTEINSQNEDNTSYDIIHSYEDYDDYYEDFMNNSILSNKTFNNLNFCRPERFSFYKKEKKISIKNEQGFTINKTIKKMPSEIHKNEGITFISTKKENKNQLGIFSDNKNNNKDKDKNISFFDTNKDKEDNNKKESNLFETQLPFIKTSTNTNEKILFSSNINPNNKKEENKEIKKEENNKEKKEESKNLFGNIERFNQTEDKKTTLFGNSTPNKNNKEKEETPKTPKKEEKKETISTNLFGANLTPKKEIKIEEKKEMNDKENKKEEIKVVNKTPLSITAPPFVLKEKKENNKLSTIKEENETNIEEKENKENKETNKPLFGNITFQVNENSNNTENKGSLFGNSSSLFGNSSSLFGNTKETNNNNNLFNNNAKKEDNINEKKEKTNTGLFSHDNNDNTKSLPVLIEKKSNSEIEKGEIKSSITSNARGSLAVESNPFLSSISNHTIPNVFSANNLINNNNKNEINTPNEPMFKVGNNNTNLFGTDNNQQKSFFSDNNQAMGGGMDMSPKNGPKNLFGNNPTNSSSLFGNNIDQNNLNIFGAPKNPNTNSLFNNNGNNNFSQNSGSIFGPGGLFTGANNNSKFSFSMGIAKNN